MSDISRRNMAKKYGLSEEDYAEYERAGLLNYFGRSSKSKTLPHNFTKRRR